MYVLQSLGKLKAGDNAFALARDDTLMASRLTDVLLCSCLHYDTVDAVEAWCKPRLGPRAH